MPQSWALQAGSQSISTPLLGGVADEIEESLPIPSQSYSSRPQSDLAQIIGDESSLRSYAEPTRPSEAFALETCKLLSNLCNLECTHRLLCPFHLLHASSIERGQTTLSCTEAEPTGIIRACNVQTVSG
jgi:hypothetical protein